MNQQKLRTFTERYLQAHHCTIIEAGPKHILTQLSIEADKDLLQRPFYWMYVERMNLPPQPSQLCLIFDADQPPPGITGEYLFFGSPRFTRILESAKKRGRFGRFYQVTPSYRIEQKPYLPWLAMNFLVSYVCDQKKDHIFYLGINLYNGEIADPFYPTIKNKTWTNKLPAHRYLLPSRLGLGEAVGELEYYLQEKVCEEEHTWAQKAHIRLEQELQQMEYYFTDDDKKEEKEQRRRELIWQYYPRVEVNLINAGLFYVDANDGTKSNYTAL